MGWLRRATSEEFDYGRSRKSGILFRFWGNSALYGITSLLCRLGSFLALPLYWHRLPPREFGLLALSELVSLGLGGILTLCLESALSRFYYQWPEEERRRKVGALWVASVISAAALAAVAYGTASLFWDKVVRQVPFSPYIQLAIGLAFVRSFSNLPFGLLRVQERVHRFTISQLASLGLSTGLGLYLVLVRGYGATGILLGSIAGYLVTAVFWAFALGRMVRRGPFLSAIRPALNFSLPLVPATLLSLSVQLCDRYFLDRFAPLPQIGLYAIAIRFASIIKEANGSLKNSWNPLATRLRAEREDGVHVVSRLANYYIAALMTVGLGVALLSREFLELFGPGYQEAYALIPVLVLATMWDPFDNMAGLDLSLKDASRTLLLLVVFEAVVTFVLVASLTARWGVAGTVYATLASRTVSVALRVAVSLRGNPVPYRFPKLLGMVLLGGVAFAASTAGASWSVAARIAMKSGLLLAFVLATAWWFLDVRRGIELLRQARAPDAGDA